MPEEKFRKYFISSNTTMADWKGGLENKHYFGFQILQVQEMKLLESLSQTNDSYYDY